MNNNFHGLKPVLVEFGHFSQKQNVADMGGGGGGGGHFKKKYRSHQSQGLSMWTGNIDQTVYLQCLVKLSLVSLNISHNKP